MAQEILISIKDIMISLWKDIGGDLFLILILSIGYIEVRNFLFDTQDVKFLIQYLWPAIAGFPCIAMVMVEKEIFSIKDQIAPIKLYDLDANKVAVITSLFISKWILSLIPGCIYYYYLLIRGFGSPSASLLFLLFQIMAFILSPFQYGVKSIIFSIILAVFVVIIEFLHFFPLTYLAMGYLFSLYLLYVYSFIAARDNYLIQKIYFSPE